MIVYKESKNLKEGSLLKTLTVSEFISILNQLRNMKLAVFAWFSIIHTGIGSNISYGNFVLASMSNYSIDFKDGKNFVEIVLSGVKEVRVFQDSVYALMKNDTTVALGFKSKSMLEYFI